MPKITKIDDLDILDQFRRKEYRFKEIIKQHDITGLKVKKTKEDVFEFEFYDLIKNLLSVIYAFEEGTRKPLKPTDYYELLGSLKHTYKTFKGNIKYLEDKD